MPKNIDDTIHLFSYLLLLQSQMITLIIIIILLQL